MVQHLDELMQHDPNGRNAHAMLKPERKAEAKPSTVQPSVHPEVPLKDALHILRHPVTSKVLQRTRL